MNSKHLRGGLAVALLTTGCQVNNGVLCSYLNDNCGEDAGEDETGDPEPLGHPCDQIGAALGLDLVHVSYCVECESPWWGQPYVYNLDWSQIFPSGWAWDATPPLYNKPSRLRGIQGELGIWWGGDKAEAVVTWTQTEGIESGHRGLTPVQIIEQNDGSQIVWLPAGPDGWMTLFSGSAAVLPSIRGWSSKPEEIVVEFAGPSGTNAAPTTNDQKGFEAVRGQCRVAEPAMCDMPGMCEGDTAGGGSGDGGGTTGGTDDVPPGEDPCMLVAEYFDREPLGDSRPWAGTVSDPMATYLAAPPASPIVTWNGSGWEIPAEGLASIGPFGDMAVHPTAEVSDDRAGWIVVPADQAEGWEIHWHVWNLGAPPGLPSDTYPSAVFEPVGTVDGTDLVVLAAKFHRPTWHVWQRIDRFRIVNTVSDDSRRLAGVVVGYDGLEPDSWMSASDYPGAHPARLYADGRSWLPMGGVCLLDQAESGGGSTSTGEVLDESGG
jgi:hypothetical protein